MYRTKYMGDGTCSAGLQCALRLRAPVSSTFRLLPIPAERFLPRPRASRHTYFVQRFLNRAILGPTITSERFSHRKVNSGFSVSTDEHAVSYSGHEGGSGLGRADGQQGERERHAAAAWIGAHLGGNSGAELTKAVEQLLEQRFDGHWYPSEPDRGSAYRVMKTSVDELDPLLARAAVSAGVSPSALHAALLKQFPRTADGDRAPGSLYLWVNPGEVKALHPDRRSHNKGKESVFGEPPPNPQACALRLKIERTSSCPSPPPEPDAMSDIGSEPSSAGSDEYSDC